LVDFKHTLDVNDSMTSEVHHASQQQAAQQAAQQQARADEAGRLRAQLAAAAAQGRALPPDVQAYIQQLQVQQAHQLHQHQVVYLPQGFCFVSYT
jgi:hypothetical protein